MTQKTPTPGADTEIHELTLDELRQAVGRPAFAPKSFHLSVEMARLLAAHSQDQLPAILGELAAHGDVAGLAHFVDDGIAHDTLVPSTKNRLSAVVAHMLVDGSGNEAFARRWIKRMGADPAALGAEFQALATAKRPTVRDAQRLIGLGVLIGNPFELLAQPKSVMRHSPPAHVLLEDEGLLEPQARAARELLLGLLLQRFMPGELPKVYTCTPEISMQPGKPGHQIKFLVTATPLARLMWSDESGASRHFPLINEVYGNRHAGVCSQIEAGFLATLEAGELDLSPQSINHYQVMALTRGNWLGREALEKLLKGTLRCTRKDSDGRNEWGSIDFPAALATLSRSCPDEAIALLSAMREAGVDVNQRVVRGGEGWSEAVTLLEEAARYLATDLFKDLIAHGADPRERGWGHTMRSSKITLPTAIERVAEHASFPEANSSAVEQSVAEMESVLRSWLARAAAQEALEDLADLVDDSPSCPKNPTLAP